MKYYIGVTDYEWFTYLKKIKPDEVNFWRPGGQIFATLKEGEPFLFKLHSPYNYIVGGGFFYRYTRLPLSMAWKVFGEKNGVQNYIDLSTKIYSYLSLDRRSLPDPEIGCIILVSPFFFEEKEWIAVPENWSSNIVTGKTYDTTEHIGHTVWEQVEAILKRHSVGTQPIKPGQVLEAPPRYGTKYYVEARLGQGAFRSAVIDSYNRRCAISGEKTVPVLEAAHIKPYSESGPHSTKNGILLRADLHILLDQGYITVTKDLSVKVSRKIKEEYENGRDYYIFDGNNLRIIPSSEDNHPAKEYLDWHNQNVFRG
jgi:putative restriction endonuclease